MHTSIFLNKFWYTLPVDFRSCFAYQKNTFLFFSYKSKNTNEPSWHTVLQLSSLTLNLHYHWTTRHYQLPCDQKNLHVVPSLKFLKDLKLPSNELLQVSVYFRLQIRNRSRRVGKNKQNPEQTTFTALLNKTAEKSI